MYLFAGGGYEFQLLEFKLQDLIQQTTQGLLGPSRRGSDDADNDNDESLLSFFFKKDVKKMKEKDDGFQTNFGATRCSIREGGANWCFLPPLGTAGHHQPCSILTL